MYKLSLFKSISFLMIATMIVSCSDGEDALPGVPSSSSGDDVEFVSPTDPDEEEALDEVIILFMQDFEEFSPSGNWFLSDFDLDENSLREEFVENGELKFSIDWTARSRKQFADFLEVDRSAMTKQVANEFCRPKLEIGKLHAYDNSNDENLIAELDTDSRRCGLSGNTPATVGISSFIPTDVGYKYKLTVDYKMRNYSGQVDRSYKDLVVRFGPRVEKFNPVFEAFESASVEIVAIGKYSKITLRDNGLPDSYGVLIDNIKVEYLGKVEHYDSCSELFKINSKGFKKCIQGEISSSSLCHFTPGESSSVVYKEGSGVVDARKNTDSIFLDEGIVEGKVNFLSLGLKGRAAVSCTVDGYKGLFSIFQKTVSFQEVSWGGATPQSYPELARVRIALEECDEDSLNRIVTLGQVATAESFSFTFDNYEDGKSFSGCKMRKFIIKDITPSGKSADGVDINSFKIE